MIIKETIKKEISLTIDDIKTLILRDLNIEEKEGVIVIIRDYTECKKRNSYVLRLHIEVSKDINRRNKNHK